MCVGAGETRVLPPSQYLLEVGGCAAILGTHLLSLMPVLACHQAGQLHPGSGQTWDPSCAGSETSCLQHFHNVGIRAACEACFNLLWLPRKVN